MLLGAIIDGQFRTAAEIARMQRPRRKRSALPMPMVQSDLPAYRSPLGRHMVDGKRARREELARNHCREVDPGEFKVEFHNERFARKIGYEHTPAPEPKLDYEPAPVDRTDYRDMVLNRKRR